MQRLRRAARTLARALLRLAQSWCVGLAHVGKPAPRSPFDARDLLKAWRISRRIDDGDAVLDVGCGSGHVLAELQLFRRIEAVGVDVSIERAAFPEVALRRFDGRTLPFADGAFAVTLLGYVLHHLTPEHAAALLREAIRVSRRRVILQEDSLPSFGRFYRARNRIHRLEAGLEYAGESPTYRAPSDEAMFLTHDGWRAFLGGFQRVRTVAIEPLDDIMRYRHHTLIDVELEAAG